jgi:hypothetical protein
LAQSKLIYSITDFPFDNKHFERLLLENNLDLSLRFDAQQTETAVNAICFALFRFVSSDSDVRCKLPPVETIPTVCFCEVEFEGSLFWNKVK